MVQKKKQTKKQWTLIFLYYINYPLQVILSKYNYEGKSKSQSLKLITKVLSDFEFIVYPFNENYTQGIYLACRQGDMR